MSLATTAYHEAGHALADFHFGFEIREVTIVPGDGFAGKVSGKVGLRPRILEYGFPTDLTVARWHKKVISLLAGQEAQRAFKPTSLRSYMSRRDHEAAVDIVCKLHPWNEIPAVVKWLEIRTRNLVNNPVRWIQIQDLAQALLEKRTLNGEDVKSLLAASFKRQMQSK